VFDKRIGDVSGRGKLAADMREIWVMQPRFEKRSGSTPFSMIAHIRFRAGFDFLRLRADVGEVEEGLAEWWQQFSLADDARREDMIDQMREEQRTRQRKAQPVARRVPKAADAAAPAADAAVGDDLPGDGAAPKKRRRRRRKPAGGAAEGGGHSGAAGDA
ncbi:MAG: polynucleotide adenylyltransferase PcnB, partial [Proteobacteria bacterium]|nr:polynucleotide adenylyltransferase PcnB [Pseudomonadota bacterium]